MSELRLKEMVNRFRVRTGLLVAVGVILLARPTWLSILAGVSISIVALSIRAWAAGHLRKEKELAISGPYRYSRNPLYLGNFLLGIGIVVGSWSFWVLLVLGAYYVLFYPPIIKRERERLRRLFPDQYEEYGKKVPLFLPSFKRHSLVAQGKFSFSLYKKNKEYRAILGSLLIWLVLAAKILLLNR